MRISDWSSDVCSSDLGALPAKESRVTAKSLGGLVAPLVTSAGRSMERPRIILLKREDAGLIGFIAGQEGFDTLDVERTVEILNPARALPSTAICLKRSEERRVGKECVSTCRSRWSRYH